MTSTPPKTAILFFTRSESSEIRWKSFGLNRKKSFLLAKSLISRTRNLLQESPFPVFEIGSVHEPVHIGFIKALESIWDQGFERIISVGNDCPQLKISDLLQADKLLDSAGLVAGPDHRGGVYLLGIHKSSFNRDFFLGLPWHTSRFFSYLAAEHENMGVLHNLHDLNHKDDLFEALKAIRSRLLRFLITLIAGAKSTFPDISRPYEHSPSLQFLRRGPPCIDHLTLHL